MRFRRLIGLLIVLALLVGCAAFGLNYVKAASLIVRAAHLGGRVEALAASRAYAVTRQPAHSVPTRHGAVPAQFYVPDRRASRTILLVPGIHSMGIEEVRLTGLATDLAATGFAVMTMGLPDLERYRITPDSTDVIEDAIGWMTRRQDLAPDGRVGVIGISFAGGLSVAAASRPAVRDKLAFVLSFGGHGDLPRVMRYLVTGEEETVPGVRVHPPHDYGVAVILYGLADRGIVPSAQVQPLRDGISTFLLASQQAAMDRGRSDATFAQARQYESTLPEPARTYMHDVNERAVQRLGPALLPYLQQLRVDDASLSPGRASLVPRAPIYLLHGDDDTVIPAAESILLGRQLREQGAEVHVLLSGLITHAEVDRSAAASETWKLVSFWAGVLSE